ncbi:hypothetical protein [Halpernia sp.]|uniref:hypothetical protein n=1 Tax=Halpernia sp. TaxID=2782209 RepID=UPI003A921894
MKKLLLLLILISVTSFGATRTGYYTTGQTKAQVLENVKTFEKDMIDYKYVKNSENKSNQYDYTQTWSYESKGAVSTASLRYQFFDDKVLVTMYDAAFISKEGKRIPLQENDPTEAKRNVYNSLENIMITVFFKYLKVSETKGGSANTSASGATYDMITKNYAVGDNKESSKKVSKQFIDTVLKIAYKVTYLTSENEDNQEIKYTLEDETGIATTIIDYQFRDKDFTIKIKSINYYHKGNKSNTVISKESSSEATSKFYNLIKTYFLEKHSDYISPNI